MTNDKDTPKATTRPWNPNETYEEYAARKGGRIEEGICGKCAEPFDDCICNK